MRPRTVTEVPFSDPPTALSIDLAKLFLGVLEESNASTDSI